MSRPGRPIGVLTGVRSEARLLAPLSGPQLVACSGADAGRARRLADRLIDDGAAGLVSFGLAGGLAEGWAAGRVVLAEAVVLPDGGLRAADRAWRADLQARAGAAGIVLDGGTVAGSETVVATAAGKRALGLRTAAVAVDMESHAVALAAEAAGIPFLVLRAIADPWRRAIPAPALAGVGPDGSLRPFGVAMALIRSPASLPGLLHLARDSRRGLDALARVLGALGRLDLPPTSP